MSIYIVFIDSLSAVAGVNTLSNYLLERHNAAYQIVHSVRGQFFIHSPYILK